MKNIIFIALTTLMMVGCYQAKAYYKNNIELVGGYRLETIEYQSCEYVVMQSNRKQQGTMIHKGNCRFCKERRQKELNYIVEQLKKK